MVAGNAGSGWQRIGLHPAIHAWAVAAREVALRTLATTTDDWRCGGTWFVGVDALPSDRDGSIGGTPFPWDALPLTPEPLHAAQLSVIRPGYPQPSAQETPAAFTYRQTRDAAHLDGLLPIGPDKRRMIREPHAWILGLPLNDTSAAPLTVWDGSHVVMRAALHEALRPHPPETWGNIDVTDAYLAARKQVFATCPRIELAARPGEATLLHRLALHGVAPWKPDDSAPPEGRMIAYLRPQLATVRAWLAAT